MPHFTVTTGTVQVTVTAPDPLQAVKQALAKTQPGTLIGVMVAVTTGPDDHDPMFFPTKAFVKSHVCPTKSKPPD